MLHQNAQQQLLSSRNAQGHWRGYLSSSALSTATAVIALSKANPGAYQVYIQRGLSWLAETQNPDGGWGDTTKSYSNISTSLLCWSAFGTTPDASFQDTNTRAEAWLKQQTNGSLSAPDIAKKVIARYGKDKTFSVPILMACALGGRLGDAPWKYVPALPFELAAFPRSWFAALSLPVVSYALPALIAIGQVIHQHKQSWNPIALLLRRLTKHRTQKILLQIQPSTGGYLEATPLTSFVTMALAGCGHTPDDASPAGQVMSEGIRFLLNSIREDGSWPIDTDLATWVTTLSINALKAGDRQVFDWLLEQQYKEIHPFTQAKPGAWAWTDLPGGVPDADDTSGAIISLHYLAHHDPERALTASENGIIWLLDLQNRDGGVPTFCRGWGTLPFDRSCNDITAHALHAWAVWENKVNPRVQARIQRSTELALAYLKKTQANDGHWLPLWFGNQDVKNEENPTYGTARVLSALTNLNEQSYPDLNQLKAAAIRWLQSAQNENGSWGGSTNSPPSIEETALAAHALQQAGIPSQKALDWLDKTSDNGQTTHPSPIGFYFAKLWYYEQLYPAIFLTSATSA
jgi:squalene-hopene/tetraprenyl-beta-curcumene cyclase